MELWRNGIMDESMRKESDETVMGHLHYLS
jgi:hypothetical protein